jgi:hypothetical protein
VKLNFPKDYTTFKNCIEILKKERKKAENALLDELENDVDKKEEFITK